MGGELNTLHHRQSILIHVLHMYIVFMGEMEEEREREMIARFVHDKQTEEDGVHAVAQNTCCPLYRRLDFGKNICVNKALVKPEPRTNKANARLMCCVMAEAGVKLRGET